MICDPTPVVDYKFAVVRSADPKCLARLVKAFQAFRLHGAALIRIDPVIWTFDRNGVLARR